MSAHDGFNARADAEALNDAMKGMGANEKALFAILCKRTFNQRCQIAKEYKAAFGQVSLLLYRIELISFKIGAFFSLGSRDQVQRGH